MGEIVIIAAVAANNVIGKNGKIPWHIPADFKHFKEITWGYPCIMGDRTYESLPIKPLPGRENIVLTLNRNYNPKGAKIFYSFKEALDYCKDKEKVFIIGGASVYRQALPIADRLELTKIHKEYDGDTFFPQINFDEWVEINRQDFEGFSFLTYVRKNKKRGKI